MSPSTRVSIDLLIFTSMVNTLFVPMVIQTGLSPKNRYLFFPFRENPSFRTTFVYS
jgi:hypothetical protein